MENKNENENETLDPLVEGAPWVSEEVVPPPPTAKSKRTKKTVDVVIVEDDPIPPPPLPPPPPTASYTQIRYRLPDRYIVRGPSGARYEFDNTHRESAVLASDVPFLLGKVKHSGGCCGAPKQVDQVFELV